ncbi:serine hydrolase domain-containing protein [Rhodopirellula sp. JC639]|uniref:serine hydrolase domain-containing protein n=1 Tax=Stieleria mannarensis TaxID=2755585 RepID=UPI00160012C2|nr:serine hydrolase domain-containing protein [Rhodopirellula sp. JC639]
MLTQSDNRPTILGSVAPGFEQVRTEFENNFLRRGERGAACTVFHQGRKVVDLWGGRRCHHSGARWTEQTLSLAFSVTKGMAAAVMAVAHSRGLFDLDAAVADYWPEFAVGQKQTITVRQLLAHQAGLVAIDRKLNPQILADHDQMAAITASQKPLWQPGTKHGYHTLTLGWYQNELIRRVDPAGRTLGEFFHDEIATPLGIEFYIGLPDWIDSEHISSTQGFRKLALLANLNQLPWKMVLAGAWPGSVVSKSIKCLKFDNPAALGTPEYRNVEIPSANGFGQARAVAKVYDVLARGGQRLGITPATMRELVAPPLQPSRGLRDAVLKIDTNYGFGFSRPSSGFRFGADDQAFGCPGAGGSFGMADPVEQLSFAYLTNTMSFRIFDDPRERSVRQAVYQCIGSIEQQPVESDTRAA